MKQENLSLKTTSYDTFPLRIPNSVKVSTIIYQCIWPISTQNCKQEKFRSGKLFRYTDNSGFLDIGRGLFQHLRELGDGNADVSRDGTSKILNKVGRARAQTSAVCLCSDLGCAFVLVLVFTVCSLFECILTVLRWARVQKSERNGWARMQKVEHQK